MNTLNSLVLTREQAQQVDRTAVEQWGMSSLVLMENAGRGVADVLSALGIEGRVIIACAKGNNGGDGFVVARHLHLRGYPVEVWLGSDPKDIVGDALANFQILSQTTVSIHRWDAVSCDVPRGKEWLSQADWLVDAMLGTGGRGNPRPPLGEMIRIMNASLCKRLAIDIPSGLDCNTGGIGDPTFRADHTCTFVATKPGLNHVGAQQYVGELHVLDIGVPPELVQQVLDTDRSAPFGH